MILGVLNACSQTAERKGPLISEKTTMVTAWQVPLDPTKDPSLTDPRLADQIKWGYRIFTNTPHEAARFTGGNVSCNNCHLNAGQRERSLPLVGVAGMFPEYNGRAARLISLNDRIVDCFWRSENGTGVLEETGLAPLGSHDAHGSSSPESRAPSEMLPSPTSKEVLAIAAYLTWLARGTAMGKNPAWRGQNTIAPSALIPVGQLDRRRGEDIFKERCTNCHGLDGQGVAVGDKKPGPLWGPNSWNDGAGAARVYTLAGIIRYSMPYLNPGSLTDEEAQLVAAFINSQPRPVFPFKPTDYLTDKLPADAVYYPKR